MITEKDARNGYEFIEKVHGHVGSILLLNTDFGTVHISLQGDGYDVDVFPMRGMGNPVYFSVPSVENARILGMKLLRWVAQGVNLYKALSR
ncbi:hypothetical protein [Nocardia grenadensis]|uniref:hypothetical protein n=1 Tax=Nocardia grenadensis TaxID=931537 RepID=UPI003D75B294